VQQYTKLWKGGLPDAPGWLAENGWEPQLHDRATVALSYGRPQAGPSIGGFVIAARASSATHPGCPSLAFRYRDGERSTLKRPDLLERAFRNWNWIEAQRCA
jgi:hypothetical protein